MTNNPRRPQRVFRSTAPRIAVNEPAKLLVGDQRIFNIVIVDTSEDGFRIRGDHALPSTPKAAILRVNRYGDYAIEIKWVRGNEAGGVFLNRSPELP